MPSKHWLICVLTLVSCGDQKATERRRRSPLETGIARDLTARLNAPVTVTCTFIAGIPSKCEGALPDGTKVPLEVKADKKDWAWHVAGLVIEEKPIAAYVEGALADLHVDQRVDCSPAIHVISAGDRIACKLSGGGLAFVQFAADGSASLELALDKDAAAARGELVTPDQDRALIGISKSLEGREGQSDGEEAVPSDATVAP